MGSPDQAVVDCTTRLVMEDLESRAANDEQLCETSSHKARVKVRAFEHDLQLSLEVRDADGQVWVCEIAAGETYVGRGARCQVRVRDSSVSRIHAVITRNTRGLVDIVDLDSRNGVWVNGRRRDREFLCEGDRIELGAVCMQLHVGPTIVDEVPTLTDDYQNSENSVLGRLSPRQREVATLAARGSSNVQIADKLNISGRTVSTHLEHIYQKLEISSRLELARLLLETSIVR